MNVERVMMVAGEASGDMIASRVIRELRLIRPSISISGIGGEKMIAEGFDSIVDMKEVSVVGFLEVAKNYRRLKSIFNRCVEYLEKAKPDVLVLVDFPGFNLRFAAEAKKRSVRVVYYVAPQVWIWGRNRIQKIKKSVDRLAVIFDFEEEIFRAAGVPVRFVGHPLHEILPRDNPRDEFRRRHELRDAPIVALLPGSRDQEITTILPRMIDGAMALRKLYDCTIAVGAAPTVASSLYRSIIGDREVHLIEHDTHMLMQHSFVALVSVGTATLETAMYQTPHIVVYRTSALTYAVAKRLVTLRQIGLANILAGAQVVPELIQRDFSIENIVTALRRFFDEPEYYQETKEKLRKVTERLGSARASRIVAEMILGIS